jgi:antitoxin ParD1/3/4
LANIAIVDFKERWAMPTRNVVLTGTQDDLVRDLVSTGRYQNASEVVRAGLRLLEDHEAALLDVRAGLREGLGQADRGETIGGEAAINQAFERALEKARP